MAVALFGGENLEKALDSENADGNETLPDPVGKFLECAQFPGSKSTASDFSESSAWRFEKTQNVIEEFFEGHPTECEAALAIAKALLTEVRATFSAKA